ncbi:MAG: hypothetical protein C4302_05060 [Thermus sp.]
MGQLHLPPGDPPRPLGRSRKASRQRQGQGARGRPRPHQTAPAPGGGAQDLHPQAAGRELVRGVPHQPLPPSQEAVGIDLGLIHFASTSDGETFAPPKAHQKAEARLKRTQKALSKKQRCSNRYRKLQKQLARYLVNRYGTIAHEDLNLAGLHRTRLAKSFSDADHAQFISILLVFAARSNSAKAASAGRLLCEANTERVIAVRPHGTSQTCPNCGSVRKKELSERIHVCECGCVLDRDVAAAKVILALGLDGALGDGQRVAAPI